MEVQSPRLLHLKKKIPIISGCVRTKHILGAFLWGTLCSLDVTLLNARKKNLAGDSYDEAGKGSWSWAIKKGSYYLRICQPVAAATTP